MNKKTRMLAWLVWLGVCVSICQWGVWAQSDEQTMAQPAKAVVITCSQMIDDGLFYSIKRRTREALDAGATHLIYEMSTYGGLVKSADDISKFILETQSQAHTIAYVKTEAISAGAMISVSCQDIIMREHTTIGDCAPIVMGGTLEGVEREKQESFVRAIFQKSAKANGYPEALLKAMVSMQLEVYQIENRNTGQFEYFDANALPTDPNAYDLGNKQIVVKDDELLTVDAQTAKTYGIARAVVQDVNGLLAFIESRDNVTFESGDIPILEPNWSEQMVRAVNNPTVTGILLMVALLGLYIEFSSPGLGLPGLVSLICFVTLIGSKYLVGLANWIEIAVFVLGVLLLLIELLVIPGFGIAGIAGIACMITGALGMMLRNDVGPVPWPQDPMDWQVFEQGLQGLLIGIVGFVILAILFARYMPHIIFLKGLILVPSTGQTSQAPAGETHECSVLKVGDIGTVVNQLHPTGRVRFGDTLKDCITQGDLIDPGEQVEIIRVQGNHIVVKPSTQV